MNNIRYSPILRGSLGLVSSKRRSVRGQVELDHRLYWNMWGTHTSLGEVSVAVLKPFSLKWENLKKAASLAVTTGCHCYLAREKQREVPARPGVCTTGDSFWREARNCPCVESLFRDGNSQPRSAQGIGLSRQLRYKWDAKTYAECDHEWWQKWHLTTLGSSTPSPVLVHISVGSGLHSSNNWGLLLIEPGHNWVIITVVFVDQGKPFLLRGRTGNMKQAKNKLR